VNWRSGASLAASALALLFTAYLYRRADKMEQKIQTVVENPMLWPLLRGNEEGEGLVMERLTADQIRALLKAAAEIALPPGAKLERLVETPKGFRVEWVWSD